MIGWREASGGGGGGGGGGNSTYHVMGTCDFAEKLVPIIP